MELQLSMPPEEVVQGTLRDSQLSEAQSLELVKIFLNSSIACICHTRELLRWTADCLRTRFIEQVSLDCQDDQIYDKFLKAQIKSPTSSQQVRVLVRTNNERANRVLDMLEFGVFDALKSSYLDVLQVFVATNSEDAKSIVETYTYHFDYEDECVRSIRLDETDQSFTLSRSQKSFKAAIRGLLRAMQELPRLPKQCVLGMSMSYTNGCPDIYEPLGFKDASTHTIVAEDWNKLWEAPSSFAGSFSSTHHSVKVAAKGSWSFDPTTSQLQDTLMSKELQNMQKTSSSRNHAVQSTLPDTRSSGSKRKEAEKEEDLHRTSKRTRETQDIVPAEVCKLKMLISGGHNTKEARDDIDVLVTDNTPNDPGTGILGPGATQVTPRQRKKSISKMFVAVDNSTPASQRFVDETESENDTQDRMRSSRASSATTDDDLA